MTANKNQIMTLESDANLRYLSKMLKMSTDQLKTNLIQAIKNVDQYFDEDYVGDTIESHSKNVGYLLPQVVVEAIGPYTKQKENLIRPLVFCLVENEEVEE